MAWPTSPVDGELFGQYKWNATVGAWEQRITSGIPADGDYDMGLPYSISNANRNATAFWSTPCVTGTFYSTDFTTRVPAGVKAIIVRLWVQKSTTVGGDWFWLALGSTSTSIPSDGATWAFGAEHTYASGYHHTTMTVPIIPGDTTFQMYIDATGAYNNVTLNPIGYHI